MKRSGFSMIEISIGLTILAIVLVATVKNMSTLRESVRFQNEINFYAKFDRAVAGNFELIVNTFEPICSPIISDVQAGWGWQNASCNQTSPLPSYTAANGGGLVYKIQWASLSAQQQATVRDGIVASLAPECRLVSVGASDITLRCANLQNLTYDLGAGPVASAHTVGADINPTIAPSYQISLLVVKENGNVAPFTQTHSGSLNAVWQKRQNYSLEKINGLSAGLKNFYNSKLIAETQNVAPSGLNSTDDEFVPWHWEAFGANQASVAATACVLAGGICTNLTNPNVWRTGNPSRATLMRYAIANVGAGNANLATDGFGNMLRIVPITSTCSNTNLLNCTDVAPTAAPAIPADNYYAGIIKPPHGSILFSATCNDTTTAVPDYCRHYLYY